MNTRVYIAGPITGVRGYKNNFRKAAKALHEAGYIPVDPTAPGDVAGADYRFYINRGLILMQTCDMICMLPGSEGSKGAQLELHYAVTVGLPIVQISEDYSRILGVDMKEQKQRY